MTTSTILLLFLSLAIAGGLSFFQYFYKNSNRSKTQKILILLRFLSILGILVLLINPVISSKTYEITKTPLPIIIDNSQSISELKQTENAKEIIKKISENSELKNKYDLQLYSFDEDFYSDKPIDFKGKQSNIDKVARNLKQLYRNQNYPVVLISDGNQTIGNDYEYSFKSNTPVYPIVLGDTTSFSDLKINQLNVNKYAFLKNKFPVEVFLQSNSDKNINANFSIIQGNTTIFKQTVSFSSNKKSQNISALLTANSIGIQNYRAVISITENEKNKYNNIKNFAVEVIDQRCEIALVSSINHPDLGMIKRAVETNQQRKINIIKPQEIKSLQNYDVLILYQPSATFKSIFEENKQLQLNTFIITGLQTDFGLLNQYQNQFEFKMSGQKEDFSAAFNSQFNSFSTENIGFEQFPPLENPFGTISVIGNATTLLQSEIRNIKTENPLLTFSENGLNRNAYLFGENIWKWRVESHVKSKSFDQFDLFLDKIIQYLAANASKKSLIVTHENFYNSGENIEITAEYFNKNYEFDENARLSITLKNKKTNVTKIYDFLKGNSEFKVNFDGLEPGNYSFTVKENNSNSTYSSTFEILDFEIEKQFVNPDLARLKQLATNTTAKVYYPTQIDDLIKELLVKESYPDIQKEIVKKAPIIDWKWLLFIIALTLTLEWFIRKYNGML